MQTMNCKLHEDLLTDIYTVDSGIDLDVLPTVWGNLITLTRQGHKTKWRVWFHNDGRIELTHVETTTLPAFNAGFEPGQYQALKDDLLTIIKRGYV